MFSQIFLFEIRYRLRRPAFYVYFAVVFLFTALGFAQGGLPAGEKEFFNSPAQLAEFCATMSIFLLLVSSAIMGTPLYRDLEHNTKEYYLSYPITKAGYFWGRFLGSFFFVLMISLGVILGARLGTGLGPILGWQPATRYGPNRLAFYLQPWLTLVVPTLFFTSALFFGLVAVFRNVKVIYSSGLFLFLGYIMANFFLHNIHNNTIIYLADPFLQNGMRVAVSGLSPDQLNHDLIPFTGLVLYNRILWVSIGALVLAFTWWRFSFERFFSGRASKDKTAAQPAAIPVPTGRPTHIQLSGAYYRRTLLSLTRIEILNIIRDNYFWIILSGGYIFLSFVFWNGPGRFDTRDFPRTVFFVDAFTDFFLFFVFLIIVFYTGETVHREKLTRFAFINDALPPPDWVFNTAKLLSLCTLAVFLALTPMIIGLPVQLLKGYHEFNLAQYFSATFIMIIPRLTAMVLFCYSIHLIVNNKFAAHGIAISIWITLFCLITFNYFGYLLLLYSYAPFIWASDMDGIGHMVGPISWYQLYWTLGGLLLAVIGGLFFARGVPRSARERLRLARQRFHGPTRIGAVVLLVFCLAVGSWIYYNVSYLNEYLTPWERNERKAQVEKQLKHYATLPLPRIARLSMNVQLYPDLQREETDATITMMNRDSRPIDTLLIDGDGLDFEIKYKGATLPYTCPLYFPRAKFNGFRPAKEASDYRLYILPAAMQPGDTLQFQLHSMLAFHGFQNNLYGGNVLHNGILTSGNLPGLGYDEGDEIGNNDIRKTHGLPVKKERDIPWDDSIGRRSLYSSVNADLIPYDLTVSTSADQRIEASGRLEKEWTEGGRHCYHFVQDNPGLYPPMAIASARFARWTDTVRLDSGRTVQLEIDYHPAHSANLPRYQAALKEGLRYFSRAFGPYPYGRLALVESPAYSRIEHSSPGVIYMPEHIGWVADLRPARSFDYPYYVVAFELAQQWWGNTVAPNNTLASRIIDNGVPRYAALALLSQHPDSSDCKRALEFLGWDYAWGRRTDFDGERPLLNANKWYEWDSRATLLLFALAKTIGTDSLNSALHSFRDQWNLRPFGPYPGAHDLHNTLASHIPDSLRPWFADAWYKTPTGPPMPPGAKPMPMARR
jgi:ABC-2 type transport system permease protein